MTKAKTKPGPTLRYDLAASVLIDAVFTTDEQACKKYGVSLRSLQRWRRQLADGDPNLAGFVATKKAAWDAAWAGELPAMLREVQQTIRGLMTEIRSSVPLRESPMMLVTALERAAGAYRLFADVYYTGRVIDARLANHDRSQEQLPGESTAGSESKYSN